MRERAPDLEVDGEMQADTALSLAAPRARDPELAARRRGQRADLAQSRRRQHRLQLTHVIADALPVGPILIGPAKPAHILTPSVTARGIVNMTAIAAAEAASQPATFAANL